MTETRYKEMRDQFVDFHRAHPEVYEYFRRFTFDMLYRGYKNGSAMMVIQRIRWETGVVEGRGDDFKINNNHAPFYARLFMHHFPEHDGFFRTRHQVSKDTDATGLPPLTPADYPEERRL